MKGRGFTLLELLVSIGILAIVLAIIYATFSTHVRVFRESRQTADRYQLARLILSRMGSEITCAYLPQGRGSRPTKLVYEFVGKHEEEGGYPRDRLHFISFYRDGGEPISETSSLKEIEYFIKEDSETERPSLVRREDPTPDQDPSSGGWNELIAEGIIGIRFSYYDRDGEERESWDSNTANGLPTAVRITVILEGGEEGTPFMTLVSLPTAKGL